MAPRDLNMTMSLFMDDAEMRFQGIPVGMVGAVGGHEAVVVAGALPDTHPPNQDGRYRNSGGSGPGGFSLMGC